MYSLQNAGWWNGVTTVTEEGRVCVWWGSEGGGGVLENRDGLSCVRAAV